MIQPLLYKYLVLNGQLGLPDIGSFTILRQPASVNEEGRVLQSPTQQIHFEATTVQADRSLFQFLAQETESDEVTAIGKFNEWVKSVKDKLSTQHIAELPYIGALQRTEAGDYQFKPVGSVINYPSVELPDGVIWQQEMQSSEAVETTQDSGWWIYAIILLLLGLAAIAYRYL